MDILSFFGSVWLAIFAGVFFIAMIVGCTFDRRGVESGKWWVFFLGLIAFTIYQYNQGNTDWKSMVFNTDLWKFLGIYLAIGLGYSVLEFMLEVRRSQRRLSAAWVEYKNRGFQRGRVESDDSKAMPDVQLQANSFVADYGRYGRNQIIGVEINQDKTSSELIVPRVNRPELAGSVGCWMIFWPFYAVSLIIGDLLYEVARIVADIIAKMSGRFVKMAFKGTFN